MAQGGTYRINSYEFESPPTTDWDEQAIAPGLNGIPINSGYRAHTWRFGTLRGCDYEQLAALFASQQSGNAQLTEMETDPYDASGAAQVYGTETYTDFIIQSIAPRTRGLPDYDNVQVVFEVWVG